jgi:AraC-like DNA-binding protein
MKQPGNKSKTRAAHPPDAPGPVAAKTTSRKRTAWNHDKTPIPELHAFGWNKQTEAGNLGLDAHRHQHFEICLIKRGSVNWFADRQRHTLKQNDVFVTKPGEYHGGIDSVLEPGEIYWLQPAFPKSGPLPGMTSAETKNIKTGLIKLSRRAFPGSPALVSAFSEIHQELLSPRPDSNIIIRAALYRLLCQIIRDHDNAREPGSTQNVSPGIRRSKEKIDRDPGQELTVPDLARLSGLSVSRFHERFVAEVGVTPADYRNRARIMKAKSLLREGSRPVTEIAMDLGFASSQHFASAFRRFTGKSPSEYRKQATRERP